MISLSLNLYKPSKRSNKRYKLKTQANNKVVSLKEAALLDLDRGFI